MEGGKITQSGSYEELMIGGTAFEQLVSAHKSSIGSFDDSYGSNRHESSVERSSQIEEESPTPCGKEEKEGGIKANGVIQLTEEEEKEVGDVGWKAFSHYILISKGLIFACLSSTSQCGFVAFQAAASFWLAFSVQNPEENSVFVVGIYTLISLLSAVFVYFRSLFAVLLGLKASKSFFSGFISSVFNAPMLFFDSTPVGRILTRVSPLSLLS